MPAQPIEADNLLSGGELIGFSGNRQGGEQAPPDRCLPLAFARFRGIVFIVAVLFSFLLVVSAAIIPFGIIFL